MRCFPHHELVFIPRVRNCCRHVVVSKSVYLRAACKTDLCTMQCDTPEHLESPQDTYAGLHREEDIGLIEYFILVALMLLLACPARPLPSTPRGAPESPPAAPAGEPPSTADPDHIRCSTNPVASTQRRRTRHHFLPSPSELAVVVERLRVGSCPNPPLHQPMPRPKTPDSPWCFASTPTRPPPWGQPRGREPAVRGSIGGG